MDIFWGRMFMGAVVACVGAWASAAGAAPYDDPHGPTHVVCKHDPTQSYELYIPASAPKTTSPILYAFDPGGDGKNVLIGLSEAAAANGWILAASNNSKNGPWDVIFAAQDAIIRDTEARLNLCAAHRLAAGFSGGGRSSLALAFRYPDKISGVLCMGAGWPVDTKLVPTNPGLMVRILIGAKDSNDNYDIPHTEKELMKYGVRCEVSNYEGAHDWPPAALVLSAAKWLKDNAQGQRNGSALPEIRGGQTRFEQLPPPTDGPWNSYFSDTSSGFTMYEDFQGVRGPITRVQWCGITEMYSSYYRCWLPRESDSASFLISLHPDVGGMPGPAVHEETVTAERVDGPEVYRDNCPLRHYTAHLSSVVTLSSGWVRIEQMATSGAICLWMASKEGNGRSFRVSNDKQDFPGEDLTLCLSEEELRCSFTATPFGGKPPCTIQFNGKVTGNAGEAVTWTWDFGDGANVTGDANPSHVYTAEGDFLVSATAKTPTRAGTVSRLKVYVALPTPDDDVLESRHNPPPATEAVPVSFWGAVWVPLMAVMCLGGIAAGIAVTVLRARRRKT